MPNIQRAPKSPWQKYEKSKFVYSTTYQLWREAVLANAPGERVLALTCQHAKAMHVVNCACQPDMCHVSGDEDG